MSWISSLYETYENCSKAVGVVDYDETVLLPISHSTQNAQIEIVLDETGKFIRANTVDKRDAVTIIPVTEDSGSRGNGNNPHPLCDKLCYIAGDYSKYTKEKNMEKYYNKYIKELKKWCNSPYSHKKAIVILKYLNQAMVIKDLINEKILKIDENGTLTNKINGVNLKDLFVRFIVQNYADNKYISEVWRDRSLYESYIDYYESKKNDKDICYITGKNIAYSNKHPSKIRNSRDMAKLISANDESGFTYRGRFTKDSQALSIGYNVSQKSHNALRWLIKKQGYSKDGACIVTWAINGADVPKMLENTFDMFEDDVGREVDTAKSYADRLNKAIDGYSSDLNTTARIIVMAVDAATTGRLSITYYRELIGSEFLERIIDWHLSCSWKHYIKKNDNDGYYYTISAPSPREIALSAFGTEQNGKLNANDKLIKSTVERLLPCIVDGRKFPYDIVHAAVNNAGRPTAMSGYNWQRVLSNTCAIIKKYRNDTNHEKENNKEEWSMALDVNNKDRSYLFGRLLAIADWAEYLTYERGEKRETNAKRYMSFFSKRPAKTWEMIHEKLLPYLNKMPVGQRVKYENMIKEVSSLFTTVDFNNDSLSELYLLGFYCQLDYMKNKKDKNITEGMEEEENE